MLNKRDLMLIEMYLNEARANHVYEKNKVEKWPWDDEDKKKLIENDEKSIKDLERLIDLVYEERHNHSK